jgi:four helix bundle protein
MTSFADALQERMVCLAVRILRLADTLPKTTAGRHIGQQIIRCGTASAPNYAEARAAESVSDFIHKLGIVEKELNETAVWIDILIAAEMMPARLLTDLRDETLQLCKIIHASIVTAKKRRLQR